VITAFWNKYLLYTLILLSGLSLSAQDSLFGERLRLFNEQFFAAQNAKLREEHEKALVIFEALYQKDPSNALVCYELAQLYASDEVEQDAIFYAERAAALEPDNNWYLRLKLSIYGQFGKSQLLIQSLQEALAKQPNNEDLRFQLAEAYYRNGNPALAIKELDRLEDLIGLQEEVSNQKKSLYLEIGDLDGARKELEKLIEAYPKKMDYRGALGQLYQANGKPEKAFAVFQSMLEVDSLDPRPHLDLANYHQNNGDFRKSLYHLKKAMQSKQMDMERKIAVLLSLFEASSADSTLRAESFQLLDQIVSQEPEDPRVYALYGDYLSRDGKDEEAVRYYKKALEYGEKFQIWEQILLIEIQNRNFAALREDAPQAMLAFPNQPLPYLLGGIAFKEAEEYSKARDYLEDGLSFVFNNARLQTEFHLQLAEVFHFLEDHQESDYHFEEVLNVNPKHAGALNNYAYYLSLRKERLTEALQMSERANQISPNNPVYLDTEAWILYQLGRPKEAREKIEKAVKFMGPDEAEILEHYGDILMALEETELAKSQYQRALELNASESLKKKLNQVP
jgi:tetratricopeptide (TPR) repeat protein